MTVQATQEICYFGTLKQPADIGAEGPDTAPPASGADRVSLRFAQTVRNGSEQVARLLLVASAAEHDRNSWTAVPYRMLYSLFLYISTGRFPKPPLPKLMAGDRLSDGSDSSIGGNPDDHSSVFVRSVAELVDQGFMLTVRHGAEDYFIPTEKLVKAIR